MSGSGYGYYYPPGAQNFPMDPNQSWSEWSFEQQQFNNNMRNGVPHHSNPINHTNNHSVSYGQNRSQNFYNANNRQYQQRRYNNSNPPFPGGQQNWQRNNFNKRPRPLDSPGDPGGEPKSKSSKKKKKPLSQNVPSKKDWTLEEAKQALTIEKEYNKRCRNQSLIIKFPDQDLNRDIVSNFHPSIESVHFQQPSTPRFCFVTLKEAADADAVISSLNKIRFGEGYLTAEYKKDREEDQNIGPEDIDPSTLYVGNLAQDITKEKMVETYPKNRRIDIGYAKKMKYTRYAFVSFHNINDSIEAFKQTHNKQLLSKSLIVRFRRLHGTVGMPGESKVQSPPKQPDSTNTPPKPQEPQEPASDDRTSQSSSVTNDVPDQQTCVTSDTQSVHSDVDLSVVKREINSSDDEANGEHRAEDYESPFLAGSIDLAFGNHRPMIKKEIKQEMVYNVELSTYEETDASGAQPNGSMVHIKSEPEPVPSPSEPVPSPPEPAPSPPQLQVVVKNEYPEDDDESSDDAAGSDDDGEGIADVNFSNILDQLDQHSSQIESLRRWAP